MAIFGNGFWVKIAPFKYPNGRIAWRLDIGFIDKKRIRRFFKTKEQAEEARRQMQTERGETGDLGLAISMEERAEIAILDARMKSQGFRLRDAVEFWMAHHGTTHGMELTEAFSGFFESLEIKNRDARYIQTSRAMGRRFIQESGAATLPDVTPTMIERWVQQAPLSASSKEKRMSLLSGFFKWAKRKRLLTLNPMEGCVFDFEKPRMAEPMAYGLSECKRLLNVTLHGKYLACRRGEGFVEIPFHDFLGYVTAALFLGVRPEEILRTPIRMLSLENRTLLIPQEAAKTRKRRVLEIPEVAMEWFQLWRTLAPEQTTFAPANFQKKWKSLREKAGLLDDWIHDGLRHTFASMHYAAHQNVSQLKAMMGHGESEQVLFDHYRAVQTGGGETITRKMAGEFWKLSPEQFA